MRSTTYFSLLAVVSSAVLALQGSYHSAQAQEVIVLESNVPEIEGQQLYTTIDPNTDGQPMIFNIPEGQSITVMKPSGAIETISGPRSIAAADLVDTEDQSETFNKLAQDIVDGNRNSLGESSIFNQH